MLTQVKSISWKYVKPFKKYLVKRKKSKSNYVVNCSHLSHFVLSLLTTGRVTFISKWFRLLVRQILEVLVLTSIYCLWYFFFLYFDCVISVHMISNLTNAVCLAFFPRAPMLFVYSSSAEICQTVLNNLDSLSAS